MISAISQPQYLKQTPANSGKQVAIWLVLLLQQHDHPQCCKVASARAHQGFCISELSPLQIEAAGHTLRVYVLRGVMFAAGTLRDLDLQINLLWLQTVK